MSVYTVNNKILTTNDKVIEKLVNYEYMIDVRTAHDARKLYRCLPNAVSGTFADYMYEPRRDLTQEELAKINSSTLNEDNIATLQAYTLVLGEQPSGTTLSITVVGTAKIYFKKKVNGSYEEVHEVNLEDTGEPQIATYVVP